MRKLLLSFPSGEIKLVTDDKQVLTVKGINSRPYVTLPDGKKSYLNKEEQSACASLSKVIRRPEQ